MVTGFSDVWTSQGPGSVIHQRNDSYSLYPSVTKIMGGHTVKFGGEVRRQITQMLLDRGRRGAAGQAPSLGRLAPVVVRRMSPSRPPTMKPMRCRMRRSAAALWAQQRQAPSARC